ncbi:UDP-N-acetylglucosamine 2-epimerase (non-hydrolyzing) [Christensenellaceae bacterium NSJ-44]|uniref:UDP-N-acetylglucosamine 2-epimerase (Non-hydrolyzing) n=1 Tax=Luoshenia tenuis TaxID=2763654 RepID=A0A926D1M5_9FIRM|nr:UDP-N-acetylglucosamine 2-epimerase (non-hydrolyzing) [Luoshenia tenuis]MBC8529571.1 UDP-N-acetylglucosamine 2-epimerase (non-hydrolyzing) [Luoshenia tenuis]
MKILTIVGARPQFIKAAPVSRALRKAHREVLVHTGQHYDANMSDIFFEELHIPKPDYNLGIGGGSHGQMTGRMLEAIEQVMLKEKPDVALVYGDTNSTLAGALAAGKLLIPVLHVEAGLRSFNRAMPEEQNRVLTDHIAALLSCPTQTAVENLHAEGVTQGVRNTGDVMLDAVRYNAQLAQEAKPLHKTLAQLRVLRGKSAALLEDKGYYLATIHRQENTDAPDKLLTIVEALNELNHPVIWPVHPRVRERKEMARLGDHIRLVEPVGYLDMLMLTGHARMVLTDSGGLQKEALFLGTPCTTLRDETEWVETLEGGWNVLAKIDRADILAKATRAVDTRNGTACSAFGDGNAAEKIARMV